MGADMDWAVEVREYGQWNTVCTGDFDRSHTLFGLLNGVRGNGPIFPLKGFPTDMGYRSLEKFDDVQASPTWLTLEECEEINRRYRKDTGVECLQLKSVIELMKVYILADLQVRFICACDQG